MTYHVGDYHEGEEGVSPGAKRPFKGKGSSTPPVKKVRQRSGTSRKTGEANGSKIALKLNHRKTPI